MTSFVVDEAAAGQRVDQYLAARVELSRARIQALMESGDVTLNQAPVRPSHRVRVGEHLQLTIPELKPIEPEPEDLPLSVVFQDRDLIVLDKPAGLVVHPGAGHHSGTLVNALLHHVKDLQGVGGALRPGLVHRLDKDTSGLLVVAKNDHALTTLQEAFKSREVEKEYLALVLGSPPPSGTFDTLYGRHPKHRLKFSSRVRTGKQAITHFETMRSLGIASLVKVRLETGRTHQIRVHFADAGFPLLGDALYGTKAAQRPDLIARQALHAARLALRHPRTGKALEFTVRPPADFRAAEKKLQQANRQ